MKKTLLLSSLAGLAACTSVYDERPNVIIIMADDLGCGDISALGSDMLETPNFDRLCRSGLNLTDAHSAAPTSTPSRYSLMTGLYPWRNTEAEVLTGDANMLVQEGQPTLASMMQKAGYVTGVVGKWHLGLGRGKIDWNSTISPSPNDIGFDYSYIIAATVDRVPTVYVENGNVVGLQEDDPLYVSYDTPFPGEPTVSGNPELLRIKSSQGHACSIVNGIGRIGYQKGGRLAIWNDEGMDRPFFLYYGLHQPHVPRTPHQRFVGASGLGPRGDVIIEADWCVGELLDCLEEAGLADNTIVIFSSDNGPVLDDGYVDEAREKWGVKHPAMPYRGGKYSVFDGGTHVPFFVSWPGHIPAGSTSDALVSQMDLFASLASLLGQEVPSGLDSRSMPEVFFEGAQEGREALVLGSDGKLTFRLGKLHLIPPYPGYAVDPTGSETGYSDDWALYDLAADSTGHVRIGKSDARPFTP